MNETDGEGWRSLGDETQRGIEHRLMARMVRTDAERCMRWCRDHWVWPVFALGGVVVWPVFSMVVEAQERVGEPAREVAETSAVAVEAAGVEKLPEAIEAMRGQGAEVVELGEAEGLRGYLIGQPGGGTYAAYVTPSGAVVVGLLYGADGVVVTERQLAEAKAAGRLKNVEASAQRAVRAPAGAERAVSREVETKRRAALLLEETRGASGFWMGDRGPVIHVFADPTCPFSERHVRSLKRDAEAGRLRAHVIPVGILGERGALRAVEVAGASDVRGAWEHGSGEGGDRALGASRVANNNGVLDAWRVTGRAVFGVGGTAWRAGLLRGRRGGGVRGGRVRRMSREAAMEHAGLQFALHRDAHRAWRRAALGLLVVVIALAAAVVALVLRDRPADRVVAATPDGRLIELTQLNEPVMTQAALQSWVVTAVTESFTLGFHDYQLRAGQVREYFTEQGYAGYTEQLAESRMLERIRKFQQVTSAVARGAPVITKATLWQGRAVWTVETPLLLTFHAGNREEVERLLVTVLVMRVEREERPAGIGIQQLVAERQA